MPFLLGLLLVLLGSFWDIAVDKSSVYGPFQALCCWDSVHFKKVLSKTMEK